MEIISQRDQQLAEQLLTYSVDLQKGERIMIQLIGLNGIGLIRALAQKSRELGGKPFINVLDTETQRILLTEGDDEYWSDQSDSDMLPLMKKMDAYIGIRASENIYESALVSKQANQSYQKKYLHPVHMEQRVNHTKWCILRYPSPSFAMNAKMPTTEFTDFYYKACLLDYEKLGEAMKPLEERLRNTETIRLHSEDGSTDISFSVKGQNWVPCVGRRNIPDGELFSSPIIDSVNGKIRYAPSVYQGKPFEFVELHVKDGVVVDFDSSNNNALEEILDTDEGARRFGEFSFGTNPVINSPMYDILFDEKIYGSNHLTLGQDYEVAPNGNESAIHWDLVCIGANVYLDDTLIREGRTFVKDDLKGLNP